MALIEQSVGAEAGQARTYGNVGDMVMSTFYDSQMYGRYVLMRLLRMATSLVMWAGGLLSFAIGAFLSIAGVFSFLAHMQDPTKYMLAGSGYPEFVVHSPLMSGLVMVGVAIALIGMNISVQIPYRLDTRMPGVHCYACWRCGVKVRDNLTCTNCGAFRPGHIMTWLFWAISLLVTGAWLAWDAFWFIATMFMFRGRR